MENKNADTDGGKIIGYENTAAGKEFVSVRKRLLSFTYCALFAAFIAVCAWMTVPYTIPFTLQTFGIFSAAGILGGKRGTLAVFIYIMLGVVGLPVFSGFGSGIGYVVGATGGYIVGFLFAAAVSGAMMKFIGYSFLPMLISMMAGNLVCYAFGTAWYVAVYAGETSISAVLMMCVVPYIIPDLIKIFLAALLTARLKKYIAFN